MRLSTEKKLLTVIVGLFSSREKAPTKNPKMYLALEKGRFELGTENSETRAACVVKESESD